MRNRPSAGRGGHRCRSVCNTSAKQGYWCKLKNGQYLAFKAGGLVGYKP